MGNNYIVEYFAKKKPETERNLILARLKKCKKCGFWIGKDFANKKGNCKDNCKK